MVHIGNRLRDCSSRLHTGTLKTYRVFGDLIRYSLGGAVSPRKVSSRRRALHGGMFTSPQTTQIELPNVFPLLPVAPSHASPARKNHTLKLI